MCCINELILNFQRDMIIIASSVFFRPGDYSLFEHNCNTFSEHFIFHLTGQHIPSYILNLPNEVLSTPFGASLGSALNVLSVGINSKTRLNSIKEIPCMCCVSLL